jgi:hypothetical protein
MGLRRKAPRPAHDLVLEQLPVRFCRRPQEDDPHPERPQVERLSCMHGWLFLLKERPDSTTETARLEGKQARASSGFCQSRASSAEVLGATGAFAKQRP